MKEQDWLELQEEAPRAVHACLLHFQQRYIGLWQSRLLDAEAVIAYLEAQGFSIAVSTFGIPNRKDWYCEVYRYGELLKHERDFAGYERAAREAIVTAFLELENELDP